MVATSLASNDVIAELVPGGAPSFARLSDDELLANTRRLVGRSNQLLAALLAHLAEVETRGVHRSRRCASLYTYCIYELRFSEDAAARRSAAARFAKEFPTLLDAVAAGELHLTGLLMIGPHLTRENHAEVLARAKFRTKKELTKLVRDLNPLPEVPDCIEPLGPEQQPILSARNPSWQQLAAALSPQVRELPAGDEPSSWANDGLESIAAHELALQRANGDAASAADSALPVGPVPSDLPPVTGPQLFQMQFGTVEEHVQLVERAKALLARERPDVTLGQLHLEAMKLLVAALEKRKFAVKQRPRDETPSTPRDGTSGAAELAPAPPNSEPLRTKPPRQRVDSSKVEQPSSHPCCECRGASKARESKPDAPRSRSRYVAAAVRREVYRRDDGCCTYVDARGRRCGEARYLELHHLQPFANGGANVALNLTLRCAAHNALAAETDFGRRLIANRRSSKRHEALAAHRRKQKRHSK